MSDVPQPSHPDGTRSISLLELPEEVVLVIVESVLALDLPACLRLCLCCKTLREVIDAPQAGGGRSVRAEAEARRLRWEEAVRHDISANGQVLTKWDDDPFSTGFMPWAQGPLLPVTGKSSWAIKVEQQQALDNVMNIRIGVCDAAGLSSWGLSLVTTRLHRLHRDANRRMVFPSPPATWLPPPDGWPDGHDTEFIPRMVNIPITDLHGRYGRATCAVIEVLVDHDNGVLSYRVNGGPVLEALKGFPKDATGQLRPWVVVGQHRNPGGVRFTIPYLSRVP